MPGINPGDDLGMTRLPGHRTPALTTQGQTAAPRPGSRSPHMRGSGDGTVHAGGGADDPILGRHWRPSSEHAELPLPSSRCRLFVTAQK